jgi:hypothetical protein
MSINLREISLLFEKENAFVVLRQTLKLTGIVGGAVRYMLTRDGAAVRALKVQKD